MDWPSIAVAVDRGRAGNESSRAGSARCSSPINEPSRALLGYAASSTKGARLGSFSACEPARKPTKEFRLFAVFSYCILFFKNTNTNLITVY